MRLSILCSSLAAGGTERTVADLVEYLAADSHFTLNLLVTNTLARRHQQVPSSILPSFLDFDVMTKRWPKGLSFVMRVLKLRRSLVASRTETVLSFGTQNNVIALLASIGLKLRVVVSERTESSVMSQKPLATRVLARVLYKRSSSLVVLNHEAAEFYQRAFGVLKVEVIPNGTRDPILDEIPSSSAPAQKLLCVGRLHNVKNFGLAIKTLARLEPTYTLDIVGEGPNMESLSALAKELAVADRVKFWGLQREPYRSVPHASLMLSTSLIEGFGHVIVEALARSIPVIATSTQGSREILTRGGGIICDGNDPKILADVVDTLMKDPARYQSLRDEARKNFLSHYELSRVMEIWAKLLRNAEP